MAEKETKNNPKDMIEAVPEELVKIDVKAELSEEPSPKERSFDELNRDKSLAEWSPKTSLGRDVFSGKIKSFDDILEHNKKILEPQITDKLLNLKSDLLSIGQAKGKFGGGKRRAWRQTQKKTMEGNIVTFSSMAVVGDSRGHVGIGLGKSKETLPSREKALREAKLSVIKVVLGFEDPNDTSKDDPHTVPFAVSGKCGSVRIKLLPAPRGTGLVIGDEGKKILRLAGIRDVYAVTDGQTGTTFNLANAIIDALSKTGKMRL